MYLHIMPNLHDQGQEKEASLARMIQSFLPYIQKRANRFSVAGLESDDLIQEGLIGLFRAIESYDERHEATFATYAITCINNGMLSAVKQAARKKHRPLSGYLQIDGDDTAELTNGETPEDYAIANEGFALLQSKISADLSGFEREVLSLHLEGYDYLSIAKRLDTTAKSVDNALQRARKKLKSRR